jgi:hypothetical protein
MIDFQRSPEDVEIAAEMVLPEAVVKNNNGLATVVCVGRLDVAPKKRPHTKESPGVLGEIGAGDLFRRRAAGDLQPRGVETKHRINRASKTQVIKLCFAERNEGKPVRMFLVEAEEVRDAVGVGVGKRVQQNGVDEREHRRGGANAQRQ